MLCNGMARPFFLSPKQGQTKAKHPATGQVIITKCQMHSGSPSAGKAAGPGPVSTSSSGLKAVGYDLTSQ